MHSKRKADYSETGGKKTSLETRERESNCYVIPVFQYGSELWTSFFKDKEET